MEPADMMAAVASSVQRRSGRTFDEWVDLVGRTGLDPAPGPRGTLRVGFRFRFRFRTMVPSDGRLSQAKGFAQAAHWLDLDGDCDQDDVRSLEPPLRAAYEQSG